MSIAIMLILFSGLIAFNFPLSETEKINSLVSLSPITFLIIYKKFDKISLENYNRHIFFPTKYPPSRELVEATWSERLVQMFLFFIPFLWIGVGLLIFKT